MLTRVPLWAQQTDGSTAPTLDDYYVDFAVPDLPGLGLLGFGSNSVTRPRTLKELTTSVLALSDGSGRITPAIGIAWSPAQTFRPQSVDEQRDNWLRHFLLSFGTVRSDMETNVGAGIRYMILDHADPLRAYEAAPGEQDPFGAALEQIYEVASERNRAAVTFLAAIRSFMMRFAARVCHFAVRPDCRNAQVEGTLTGLWDVREPPTPPTVLGQIARFTDRVRDVARKWTPMAREAGAANGPRLLTNRLREEMEGFAELYIAAALRLPQLRSDEIAALKREWEENHWNSAVVSIDAGYVMNSPDATWHRLRSESAGGLLAAAFPIGSRGQGILQLEARKVFNNVESEHSRASLGWRVLFGDGARRLSFETVYRLLGKQDLEMNARTLRMTAGAEFRLADGLWFEVAAGGERGRADGKKRASVLALGSLKYAFRRGPRDLGGRTVVSSR